MVQDKSPRPEADWDIWNAKKIDKVDRKELPTIVGLSIHPICKLCREDGYPTDIAALAYNKDCPIFQESHYILGAFFDDDIKEAVQLTHDADGRMYPEVNEAWRAAGQEEN